MVFFKFFLDLDSVFDLLPVAFVFTKHFIRSIFALDLDSVFNLSKAFLSVHTSLLKAVLVIDHIH